MEFNHNLIIYALPTQTCQHVFCGKKKKKLLRLEKPELDDLTESDWNEPSSKKQFPPEVFYSCFTFMREPVKYVSMTSRSLVSHLLNEMRAIKTVN